MRLLARDEVELIWTLDRSEVHHHTYELHGSELVRVPNYFEVPGWRPDAAATETPGLLDRFDRGGTFVGVFDAERLVGISVVDSARVGRGRDQVQLANLYVSRECRGRGVERVYSRGRCRPRAKPERRRSTSPPPPPRTRSTSISSEAVSSRLSPTQHSWRTSPTTSTSCISSDLARSLPLLRGKPRERGEVGTVDRPLGGLTAWPGLSNPSAAPGR
jgi:hypothetical protein